MSHTPGPWKVRHDDGVSRVFTKTKIADVYSEAFRDRETQIDNANLIAAAPDMLAALMNLENDDNSIPDHAWKLVQDAIAKVEGR